MGPLSGVKIVELAGVGPGPMAAMMLAEAGATVLRIERTEPADLGVKRPRKYDLLLRSRYAIPADLKDPESVAFVRRLIGEADALIEGFRPGVTERLGLGPEDCLKLNPKLVYGRMTGWGQEGPWAKVVGHDLNYIAMAGAVNAIGRRGGPPVIPINMVGDFGGGGMYLAFGILAAIIEARRTGLGQVVDAAIVDGTASLQTGLFGLAAAGLWNPERGTNAFDGGSYFCDTYECADGKWVSVAAIEGRFHDELLQRLGIDKAEIGPQMDARNWERNKAIVAARFKTKTREEWCSLLDRTDTCFAPVLSWEEAPHHPHLKARGTFVEVDGVTQPAPAPRFSRTPSKQPTAPAEVTPENTRQALKDWVSEAEIERFLAR